MIINSEIENSEWRWVFIASTLLMVTISLPFIWAYVAATPDSYFMGVLVNPVDGASYQAKMYQGYSGSWFFHLPYTPEPHRGVFLFTFYLALGHLSRLLGLQAILVFHAVRLVSSMLMFLAIYQFMADWTSDVTQRRISWGLAVLGTGFGWIVLMVAGGMMPDAVITVSDIGVLPEAFPLQAAYANPHFPLAIALAIWMAHVLVTSALVETERWPQLDFQTLGLGLGSLALVSMSPFVLVPLGVGYAVLCAWLWWRRRIFPRRELNWGIVVALLGLPLAAYNAWAISPSNPVFREWMSQNQTPSPPVWDYLIAFGPILILAGIGVWGSRRTIHDGDVFLIAWIVSILALLYAPLGLQRRFTMGLVVPLAIYAGIGLWRVIVPAFARRWRMVVVVLALCLMVPSTVMAVVVFLVGTLNPAESSYYYISREENEALVWLQAKRDSLVLASPDFSLYIPSRGPRVVYGHPFETLKAEERQAAVGNFYKGFDCGVVAREGVDYIVVGPRERSLADDHEICPITGEEVFQSSNGEVVIYEVSGN
ncbi:MAG: hypothetical protein JXB30_11050 [Anaerolineae bacterium]|nr:hypothetical protein [Anaerolineae bacterium]